MNGIYAAALTPMQTDLSCNYIELTLHCQDLIKRGCSGVVLFGTTGEGISFTVEEREEAVKKLIKSGIDPQKVILAISCCSVKDAVRLANVAKHLNCLAILVLPPFFYQNVQDEGVIAFYEEILRAISDSTLKMLLYHIPKYSKVALNINIIKTLKKAYPQQVLGLKESDGDLEFTKEILKIIPDFKVFVGNETQISEAVQLGAAGGISGIANAFPELVCGLCKSPDARITQILQAICNYPIFPAIKKLVEIQKGSAWQVVRPPLVSLNTKQTQALVELERGIHG